MAGALEQSGPIAKRLASFSVTAIVAIFSLGIVGEREAWIKAAQFNDILMSRLLAALADFAPLPPKVTILATFPDAFDGQVNHEPSFGVQWDLEPSLQLQFFQNSISANVLRKDAFVTQPGYVLVDGYWEGQYPFYLYRDSTRKIVVVSNEQELRTELSPELIDP